MAALWPETIFRICWLLLKKTGRSFIRAAPLGGISTSGTFSSNFQTWSQKTHNISQQSMDYIVEGKILTGNQPDFPMKYGMFL